MSPRRGTRQAKMLTGRDIRFIKLELLGSFPKAMIARRYGISVSFLDRTLRESRRKEEQG